MAGMGDVASALGGIGEAITGGVSGYIEAKKEKRVTDRQDQLWNEQQDTKAVQDITDAGNVANLRDPNIHPIYQVDQHWQNLQNPAAAAQGQTTPSQQGSTQSPSAASTPTQGGLAQAVAARQSQSQGNGQPSAQPSGQSTTMDVDPKLISKGLVEPGNIPLKGRPLISMPGGDVGSEFSTSFNQGGKEVLVPTIFDGKQHTPKEAWKHYLQTGQHLGKYDNAEDADRAAEAIHKREYAAGGSLDQTRQTSPSQQNASVQTAPPAGWEPSDPALKYLNGKYEKTQKQVDADLAKVDALAGDDPARKQRLYAAYYRLNKPKFDALQQDLNDYNKGKYELYQKQRAIDGMEKWFSGEGLGKAFGQGARKEGNTLVLPDGQQMIIETPLIWAAYKQGIATQADVMKAWGSDTKNAENLMSKKRDSAIEIERMKEQNRVQLATLRAQRDPKADMAQRVYMLHRHMGEDDAAATKAEASFIEHGDKTDLDKLKEDDMESTRAEKRVDSILKPYVDPAGGYDERKMTPSRMLDIYNSTMKTDKKAATALYLRMPDKVRATIDAQNAQDVGANRPGSGQSPTAKPVAASKPQPKSGQPAKLQKDGKDYYLWSDGKYHSKGPEA